MTDKHPHLTLLQGGRSKQLFLGGLTVSLAAAETPPFPIDAVILEEDTFLILDPDRSPRPSGEHPLRTINRAWSQEPMKPGSIIIRGQKPVRYQAIIYDFDRSPCCHHLWVAAAFASIVHDAAERQLQSLGLPLPGVAHGNLPVEASLELLREAFSGNRTYRPRLWLQVAEEHQTQVMCWLKKQ